MRLWKWIGIAGLVGVGVGAAAATGYLIQRRRRRVWRDYDADDLRDRLHARLAAAESGDPAA